MLTMCSAVGTRTRGEDEPGPVGRPRPPDLGPPAVVLGAWRPATAGELTAQRRDLAAALHDSELPAGAGDGAVERLLLGERSLTGRTVRSGIRGAIAPRLPLKCPPTTGHRAPGADCRRRRLRKR